MKSVDTITAIHVKQTLTYLRLLNLRLGLLLNFGADRFAGVARRVVNGFDTERATTHRKIVAHVHRGWSRATVRRRAERRVALAGALRALPFAPCPSHLPTCLQRLGDRHAVGIFEVAPYRQSASDARDAYAERRELTLHVECGRFAFKRWVGGEDDFVDRVTGTRSSSAAIVRSSGPTPSSGERRPPSTW